MRRQASEGLSFVSDTRELCSLPCLNSPGTGPVFLVFWSHTRLRTLGGQRMLPDHISPATGHPRLPSRLAHRLFAGRQLNGLPLVNGQEHELQ